MAAIPTRLLMPKATAVWLIENTTLTFRQIADFTAMTEIEIEALANEDIGRGLVGRSPLENSELTQEEINRCQADPAAQLKMARNELPGVQTRSKGPRYTPVSKRADKPNAIAFILKQNPEISDAQICKLVGTTKLTISRVRDRTHPDMTSIRPQHPAELGLCTYQEFENAVTKGLKAAGKDPEAVKAERLAQKQKQFTDSDTESGESTAGGFDFSNFLGDAGKWRSGGNN
ncbi:MAG: DUF1013 domain-containing protein [Alphaproteobacteria bacterium]|nr:DUF1013 domain-containing protein [Alphaproteobacteria bacterium]